MLSSSQGMNNSSRKRKKVAFVGRRNCDIVQRKDKRFSIQQMGNRSRMEPRLWDAIDVFEN